jgi:hypothetical protein
MRQRSVAAAALIAALGYPAAALRQDSAVLPWASKIESATSPAGPNSGQPQLTSSSRGLLLSWVEQDGPTATLRFSERTPSGWSAARTVAAGTDWFVNWADVPSVVRLEDGTLVGHWLQKNAAGTYAYDVRLAYSKDDGKTWSRSFTPHTDGTKTEHGFASMFQLQGSGLGLVWLDGRAMTATAGHDSHAASAGPMSVRYAAFDRAWKQTSEMPVDLRVCECCPTTAVVTADGPIAAFRNRTGDEIRDIYVSRFEGGKWTEPRAVHEDNWKINACPVNGPMLTARGRDVAIAWFTAAGGQGRALAAFSKDAGRTFGSPIRLDERGATGRVDVQILADGTVVASWIEFSSDGSQFRARRVHPSGARSAALTVSDLSSGRASGYPRIGLYRDEIVFAWTEGAGSSAQVRTAVSRAPGTATR